MCRKVKLCAALACALWMLGLAGCMTSASLKLPAWQAFRAGLREGHACISRAEGRQYAPWLNINIYYKKDTDEEELESILAECRGFLSGDGFLEEYLPFALGNVPEGSEKLPQPPLPDICVRLIPEGSDAAVRTVTAMYYTTPYRSDRELETDCYQTWLDSADEEDGGG